MTPRAAEKKKGKARDSKRLSVGQGLSRWDCEHLERVGNVNCVRPAFNSPSDEKGKERVKKKRRRRKEEKVGRKGRMRDKVCMK